MVATLLGVPMRAFLTIILLAGAAQAADLPKPPICADYARQGADIHGCDAGIASEKDPVTKSILLVRRAYMKDGTGDFAQYGSALADLTQAIALWPENWGALHERAYLYNELGEPEKAEADLDAQAKLVPDNAQLYQERALARFNRGNLQGAFEDRDRDTALVPNDAGARAARAEALMWLGRFDEAAKDIDRAATLAKSAGDDATLNWTSRLSATLARMTAWDDPAHALEICTGARDEAAILKDSYIGNCTRAFLDAKTNKDKADALTQRATALELWSQRRNAGLDDARVAAALDPSAATWGNLGSWLQTNNRPREAMHFLDLSIAADPRDFTLAERAAAKYDLGDANGAFADARKSFEMKPDELALTILGDLLFDKHDIAAAKTYWLGAYHLGGRDDGLRARLAKIGVDNPDAEANP
jgi:tetratricopeptide (TPR) repeat protein